MASGERKDVATLAAQARLIEAWERSCWPRTTPETADVLAYPMDQHGLTCADLIPLLGARPSE